MEDITQIVLFAALGVAFAAGAAVLARWAKQDPLRICAYALAAVSFVYVGFAFGSDKPQSWTAVEMTGVAIFGSLAALSLVASRWFVVAGLALHPLWAIVFHVIGSGSFFTPAPFPLADAGFTGALALYAAYVILQSRQAKAAPAAPSQQAPAQQKRGRAR